MSPLLSACTAFSPCVVGRELRTACCFTYFNSESLSASSSLAELSLLDSPSCVAILPIAADPITSDFDKLVLLSRAPVRSPVAIFWIPCVALIVANAVAVLDM